MKNTLEYKVLKHLSENDKGILIDISEIENDQNFLKSVIKDLKGRELIETEHYPSTPFTDKQWIGSSPSELPDKCKIKFSGKEYLENLEKNIIELKLSESNIRANELNEKNSKRNKRETIINIVLGIINIGLLIYQAITAK